MANYTYADFQLGNGYTIFGRVYPSTVQERATPVLADSGLQYHNQWCSAGYMQVYRVHPLIFQSALSMPTSNPPLILSVANQVLQETVYKRNYWTTWVQST